MREQAVYIEQEAEHHLSSRPIAIQFTLHSCTMHSCVSEKAGKSTVMVMFTSVVIVSPQIQVILMFFYTADTLFQKYDYFKSINKNNIRSSESLQGCWSNVRRSTVRDLPEKYFPVDDLGGH